MLFDQEKQIGKELEVATIITTTTTKNQGKWVFDDVDGTC